MKLFTKITLIIAGIMAGIGIICIIIACSMGLNLQQFHNMVQNGKFNYHFGNVFNSSPVTESVEIKDTCKNLDIEFGAGSLEIFYGDVEYILIESDQVYNFNTFVNNNTLYIEGGMNSGLSINTNSMATLTITLPQNMTFETMELEIGASKVSIDNLTTDKLIIDVGAGSAEFMELDVNHLDAEVGVGELIIEMVGKETDYSYNLECEIGTVSIGENTYSGMDTSHEVKQPDATRLLDIECSVGNVEIDFMEE